MVISALKLGLGNNTDFLQDGGLYILGYQLRPLLSLRPTSQLLRVKVGSLPLTVLNIYESRDHA